MNKPLEQGIVIYKATIVKQTVSGIFFFPSTLNDWFKLDENIRNSESISIFKCRLLPFIRPVQSNVYHIFDPKDLKFLTGLNFVIIFKTV